MSIIAKLEGGEYGFGVKFHSQIGAHGETQNSSDIRNKPSDLIVGYIVLISSTDEESAGWSVLSIGDLSETVTWKSGQSMASGILHELTYIAG